MKTRSFPHLVLTLLLLGACGGSTEYFPLEPGQMLSYRQLVRIRGEDTTQKFIVAGIGPAEVAGVTVFEQRAQRSDARFYRRREDGLYRFRAATKNDPPGRGPFVEELVLPLPVDADRQWTLGSRLRLIESRTFAAEDRLAALPLPVSLEYSVRDTDASVSVPAGRFSGCLHIVASGATTVPVDRRNAKASVKVEHHDWYAPGVGLVRSERHETSDSPFLHNGSYVLELENIDG
jgi:hypothetical protein